MGLCSVGLRVRKASCACWAGQTQQGGPKDIQAPQQRARLSSAAGLAPHCVLCLSLLWCDCLLVFRSAGERGLGCNPAVARGLVVWGQGWGVAHLIVRLFLDLL